MMRKTTITISIILLLFFITTSCVEPLKEEVYIEEIIKTTKITPITVPVISPSEELTHTEDEIEKTENKEVVLLPEDNRITMLFVGDNLFHIDNLKSAYDAITDTYDFSPFYKYVKPYITSADLAVANFESVTGGRDAIISSYPLFNTPDEILIALKDAGFDLLTTANNHCLDRGYEGLVRTIEKIDEAGMQYVGTSLEEEVRWTDVDVNGLTIRNLAYTYSCNGNIVKLSDDQLFMVNLLDESLIKEHIKRAKDDQVDLINVYLHWGNEYVLEPASWQETLAKRIFTYGADIIIATHPHVVQKSEVYQIDGENKYIIYSTGNYISNFSRNDLASRNNKLYTEDGVMVQATFLITDDQVILEQVTHIPTWPYKYIEDNKIEYRIIPIQDIPTLKLQNYNDIPNIEYMIKEATDSYYRTFERVVNFSIH